MLDMTLAELQAKQKQTLERLIEDAGSPTHLAKMLNIHPMRLRGWIDRGRVSKAGARLVAEHPSLGEHYKAEDLRPDL